MRAGTMQYGNISRSMPQSGKQTKWKDVVEDTDETFDTLKEKGVDIATLFIVKLLTKDSRLGYDEYLANIKSNQLACAVKVADITHNLSDIHKGSLRDKYLVSLLYLTS